MEANNERDKYIIEEWFDCSWFTVQSNVDKYLFRKGQLMQLNVLNETTYSPVILNFKVMQAYGLDNFKEYTGGCQQPSKIPSKWWYSLFNSMTKGAMNRAVNVLRDALITPVFKNLFLSVNPQKKVPLARVQ